MGSGSGWKRLFRLEESRRHLNRNIEVDGVLIRRLPYSEPDRLVYFDQAAHPVAQYREWEARSTVYSSI